MAIVEPFEDLPGRTPNTGVPFSVGGVGGTGFGAASRAARRAQIPIDRATAAGRRQQEETWLDADYDTVKDRWTQQKGYFDADVGFLKEDRARAYDEIDTDVSNLNDRWQTRQADFAQDRFRLDNALSRALGDVSQSRVDASANTVRSGLGASRATGALQRVAQQQGRMFDNQRRDIRLAHEDSMIGIGREERVAGDQYSDAREALRRGRSDISVRYDRAREQLRRNRKDQLNRHYDATDQWKRARQRARWQGEDVELGYDRELAYLDLQDQHAGGGTSSDPFAHIGWDYA